MKIGCGRDVLRAFVRDIRAKGVRRLCCGSNGFDEVGFEEIFEVDEAFAVEFPELLFGEFQCVHWLT
ncbi:MAG: hypothetical protein QGG64_27655 [Candidatus Latescibacteria bacterium]|nr:hypothetical protein [Candidatus Latescibacterota bacterium]